MKQLQQFFDDVSFQIINSRQSDAPSIYISLNSLRFFRTMDMLQILSNPLD